MELNPNQHPVGGDLDRVANLIWRVDGSALDGIDAVLVAMILSHVKSRPALGTASRVAIKAIVELSTMNPELAREYMAELSE